MSSDLLRANAAVIVAPHPDDEALGCGSLLAALAEAGARLGVVFVTDGGASHPRSRAWPRRRLAALRAEEAKASLAALGATDAERLHLGLLDADIDRGGAEWDAALDATVTMVLTLRPELVLAPWRRDPHRDHRDANVLAVEALRRSGVRARLLEYAVWLDELGDEADRPRPGEVGTLRLEIEAWRSRKRAAVAAHRSQLGLVVTDDQEGFVLSADTVDRLVQGDEVYFEERS